MKVQAKKCGFYKKTDNRLTVIRNFDCLIIAKSYLLKAFLTVEIILSADNPNSFSKSTAGPECPKTSLTPIL
jgi:hypothetical protein